MIEPVFKYFFLEAENIFQSLSYLSWEGLKTNKNWSDFYIILNRI